jgi:hypothetical protein
MLRRIIGMVATGTLVAASVVGLAGPAVARSAARTPEKNTRFCNVLRTQGQLDLQNLDPDSAAFATKQIDKLVKTHPPSKVKKALKAIKKFYNQIANSESSAPAIPSASLISAFTTFSSYIVSNCRATTTTT